MALGISIARAATGGASACSARETFEPFPSQLTVTITPLYTRICVQVTEDTPILAGHSPFIVVDATGSDGGFYVGTEARKTYDTSDWYANIFNVPEATHFSVRVLVHLVNDTTGEVVARYDESFGTTTRDSVVPIKTAGRLVAYVDSTKADNSGDGLTAATAKQNLDGSGTSVTDMIVASNNRGWDIHVVNGGWGNTTNHHRLAGVFGAADDWIRILPYDENSRIHNERALDGAWTDVGDGIFSMSVAGISTATSVANIWDVDIEELLFPFKDETDFLAATIGDGTGYWINNATDVLYVRLAADANPGTGRLIGAFGSGIVLQNCRYIVIDGFTFDSCSSRPQTGDEATTPGVSGAGIAITDSGGASEDIVIRNCEFNRCGSGISMVETSNNIRNILIEDCDFVFDGPWPHFYGGFSAVVPYSQATSWSEIKTRAWERHMIYANGNENLVVRNCTCRGQQLIVTAQSSAAANNKNLHVHDCEISECWDDAIGDIENFGAINAAFHNIAVTDSTTMIAFSPYNDGPAWVFNCSIDGFLHYPIKVGNQSDETESNGWKVIANISAKSKGWGSDDYRDGRMLTNGGTSNLEVYNLVIDGEQTGDGGDSAYWIEDHAGGAYNELVNTSWTNCLFHVRANATPVQPMVYWRNAAGTSTEFASFAATADGAGSDVDPDEVVFTDCVGTWSEDGDPNPFPTTIAAGLNSLITRKSVGVRGITCLSRIECTYLPIGAF